MELSFSQTNSGPGSDADRGGMDGRTDAPAVLIHEPNQSTRRLMGRALQPAYETEMTETYEELRRRAQERTFDAIVLGFYPFDVDDGLELVEALRARDRYDEQPIIAVCHPSVEADAELFREAGVNDTLRMPFGQSDLRAVLERHLKDA